MTKPIASIARTMAILNQYQLRPNKGYGQNFIIEPAVVEKIALAGGADEHTAVIEIGPGIGALSEFLAKHASEVVAFEIDRKLIDVLHDTLQAYPNVTIVHQDFLEADLVSLVSQLKETHQQVVVCANLPYYITTPLCFKLFESPAEIDAITVMMQKEVADRLAATVSTKQYNALSIVVQYQYDVQVVMKIARTVFMPKPTVDSSVIRFVPKQKTRVAVDEDYFREVVKKCFRHRRKTLLNNVRDFITDKEEAAALIEKAGLDPQSRPENNTIDQFLDLTEVLYEAKSLRKD